MAMKKDEYGNVGKILEEYLALIEEYRSALAEHFGERLRSICAFGSVARGEATPESDIDVLIVVDRLPADVGLRTREVNPTHEELKKTMAYKALRGLGRSALISDIFLTPEEVEGHPPVLLDITEDGIIIYDKEDFLLRALNSLKKRLREVGARKVVTDKGHYWVLKPGAEPAEVVEL